MHGGLDGYLEWEDRSHEILDYDEVVVEKFILAPDNDFGADLVGVPIEGAIARHARNQGARVIWQRNSDKGGLIGYTPKAKAGTAAMRQRERFDFLDRFGLFAAGTENDDTNDAITHALVSLRRRDHRPSIRAFWPGRTTLQGSVSPIKSAS